MLGAVSVPAEPESGETPWDQRESSFWLLMSPTTDTEAEPREPAGTPLPSTSTAVTTNVDASVQRPW